MQKRFDSNRTTTYRPVLKVPTPTEDNPTKVRRVRYDLRHQPAHVVQDYWSRMARLRIRAAEKEAV